MKDVLTANPEIDAIYSTDDEMSMGILQAIKEAGRTDIKVITGGGGWKDYFNIMNDYPDIWVCSQTYAPYMMNDCLEIVQKLINGETVEEKTIIPPLNVDRENYEQYLSDNGITEDAPY
jgi:ribose transport system substrate-binding protein